MTSIPTHSTSSAAPLPAPAEGSRRAEIALAAAEEFTRRGYHSTRVEHIAERLSVTPGALYRHVPGKYEMFRDAVATLATELEAASLTDPATTGSQPCLEAMVEAITRTTLRHRSRAALYRWQARYLAPADRAAVIEVDARVRRRLADAIGERRRQRRQPRHRPPGAGSAAAAILSCIASLGHHRIELSEADAVTLMTSIADDLAMSVPSPRSASCESADVERKDSASTSPGSSDGATGPGAGIAAPPRLRGGAATREGAIDAAIARFHSSGYDSVTMEAIGADVGVAASALYRHFSGKSALLAATVDRTATLVEELLDDHALLQAAGTDPADLLGALLDQYVAIAFSHGPDLMLYHSELGSLDTEDRRRLRRAQRRQLDRWAGLVLDAAPPATRPAQPAGGRPHSPAASAEPSADGRSRAQAEDAVARIRVHAALAVVLDGGQGTQFQPAVAPRFSQLAGIVLMPR